MHVGDALATVVAEAVPAEAAVAEAAPATCMKDELGEAAGQACPPVHGRSQRGWTCSGQCTHCFPTTTPTRRPRATLGIKLVAENLHLTYTATLEVSWSVLYIIAVGRSMSLLSALFARAFSSFKCACTQYLCINGKMHDTQEIRRVSHGPALPERDARIDGGADQGLPEKHPRPLNSLFFKP